MLNKTIIALTAATVIGSATASFAYEAPENKIGDSYPFLEQSYQANAAKRTTVAKMSAPRFVAPSWSTISFDSNQFSNPTQYANDVPENKISDRYPLLEPMNRPAHRVVTAGRHHKMTKHTT